MPLPQPIKTLHHIVHSAIATGMHNTTEKEQLAMVFHEKLNWIYNICDLEPIVC